MASHGPVTTGGAVRHRDRDAAVEFHEPVTALRAAVPECAQCTRLGGAVRHRVQDRDAAMEDWRAAWTPRQRTVAHKGVVRAAWWAAATGRELEWHLAQEHCAFPRPPHWRVPLDE